MNEKIARELRAVVRRYDHEGKDSGAIQELYREYVGSTKKAATGLSRDDILAIMALSRVGRRSIVTVGKVVLKTLRWVVRLYEQAYNVDALRTECARVKTGAVNDQSLKELELLLDVFDNEVVAGLGDFKNKLLARFWKKVVSLFPGLCLALRGEKYAQRLLAKAEKDFKAFREWKGYEATRATVIAVVIAWIVFLKGKSLWPRIRKFGPKDYEILQKIPKFEKENVIDVEEGDIFEEIDLKDLEEIDLTDSELEELLEDEKYQQGPYIPSTRPMEPDRWEWGTEKKKQVASTKSF